MVKFTGCLLGCLIVFQAWGQDCTVKKKELSGQYEGECKKGVANGKGKATGEDSYSGDFKNGLPDGEGKYQWKNGDWYEGHFEKGLRAGQGTMHYADKPAYDTLDGFWKKDKYIGKYERPYLVHSRTHTINQIDVNRDESSQSKEIIIYTESITGGVKAPLGGEIPRPKVTGVEILKGLYVQQFDQDLNVKRTATTFRMVQFPFRARISIGTDILDIELLEEGRWVIELKLQR